MDKKKFVSKVDEKLKAAEARRAELSRLKAEEQQQKSEMRRNKLSGGGSESIKFKNLSLGKSASLGESVKSNSVKAVNIRDYSYLKVGNGGKVMKLNWQSAGKREKTNEEKRRKLFTISSVEKLIKKGEFELSKIILEILGRSTSPSHPIQNKFAHLFGQIIEIKESQKRAFIHENALNFIGSISPVRIPDFETDLTKLSNLSSPIEMEEVLKKYENFGVPLKDTNKDKDKDMNKDLFSFQSIFQSYDEISDYKIQEHENNQERENNQEHENNFPIVISPMKRPQKDIEADVVYTPQRKSARRLTEDEIIFENNEQISQILLNDPNAAFLSNPYITTPLKRNKKQEE